MLYWWRSSSAICVQTSASSPSLDGKKARPPVERVSSSSTASPKVAKQRRALVEADQEELVVLVAHVDEAAQRGERPPDALLHAARDVVNHAERDGRVRVVEERDLLLDVLVVDLEALLVEPG